jgi:hypothetical protein
VRQAIRRVVPAMVIEKLGKQEGNANGKFAVNAHAE